MVQRTWGEAKEEKGQNGGKKGTLATEHKIRKSLKPEGGEGGEARRGEARRESFWNGDSTHLWGKARELQRIFMGSGLGFGRGTLFSGVKGKWEVKEMGNQRG